VEDEIIYAISYPYDSKLYPNARRVVDEWKILKSILPKREVME